MSSSLPPVFGAHEAKIYYVEETNYGETPANPSMIGLKAESVEPTVNPNLIMVRGVGSRDLQALKRGLMDASLRVVYPLPSDSPINFLQHIQTLKSLSIEVIYEKADGTIVDLLFKGCKMDKAEVSCSIENIVKATVDLMGQNIVVGNSKISGATYNDYAGAVPWFESYIKKGEPDGSNLTVVERATDWKFIVENNLKRVPVIRQTEGYILKYLPARHRNIYGEVIFEFETKEEYEEVVNDSEFSLEFGLGSTNKATLKHCKWQNVGTPTKIEDLVSLKASFAAREILIT